MHPMSLRHQRLTVWHLRFVQILLRRPARYQNLKLRPQFLSHLRLSLRQSLHLTHRWSLLLSLQQSPHRLYQLFLPKSLYLLYLFSQPHLRPTRFQLKHPLCHSAGSQFPLLPPVQDLPVKIHPSSPERAALLPASAYKCPLPAQ